MGNESRPVEALARGLRILEVLSRADGTMGNGQLARTTGMPPSTVSRLTNSLVQLGYLRIDPASGAYTLTPKNLRLGYPVLANLPLGSRAYKALDQLTMATGLTSSLATNDDVHMTYVAVARARHPGGITLAVGGRLPVAVSAAGIAYARALGEPSRSRLISSVARELESRGESAESFLSSISPDAPRHALNMGKWQEGVAGLAIPVRASGELYALCLIADRADFDMDVVETRYLPALWEAAEAIGD